MKNEGALLQGSWNPVYYSKFSRFLAVWAKDIAILKAQGDSPCNIYRLHCTTLQVSTVIGAEKKRTKRERKTKKRTQIKQREK